MKDNPTAPRKAKIGYNFGLSECSRVKRKIVMPLFLPVSGIRLSKYLDTKNQIAKNHHLTIHTAFEKKSSFLSILQIIFPRC